MYEKNKPLKDMIVIDKINQLEVMLHEAIGRWLQILIEDGNGEFIGIQQVAEETEKDDAIDVEELLCYFRTKRFRSQYAEVDGKIFRR